MNDKPTLPPDEAVDALDQLLARDVEIENLTSMLVVAKAALDDLRTQLKDAQKARNQLSRSIRNNAMPLFDRPPRPATTTYDDDVADGVRAAEERRAAAERSRAVREDLNFCGEFSPAEEEATRAFVEVSELDNGPISPEAMPKLTGPAKPKRGRKAAAQA